MTDEKLSATRKALAASELRKQIEAAMKAAIGDGIPVSQVAEAFEKTALESIEREGFFTGLSPEEKVTALKAFLGDIAGTVR